MAGTPSVRAVLGLGNPGSRYRETRHNLGDRIVARLAAEHRLRFREEPDLLVAAWSRAGGSTPWLLARPTTFMNRSGEAVLRLTRERGLEPAEILVVLDDLDLPFGRLRLRARGGAGTHNGLRSVVAALAGEGFPRLRVGIGPAPPGADLAEWVLEAFGSEELAALPAVEEEAVACVECVLRQGLGPAMNRFNAVDGGG